MTQRQLSKEIRPKTFKNKIDIVIEAFKGEHRRRKPRGHTGAEIAKSRTDEIEREAVRAEKGHARIKTHPSEI